jgi:trehalose-phosphatase
LNAIEAILDLKARGRLLVGLDFDGTLAPLVDHPDDALPDTAAMAQILELSEVQGIRVAVVSGRSLADLREKLGEDLPGAVLIGEHGNDTGEKPPQDDTLDAATRFVEMLRADRDVAVERKSRSVTFHTRNLGRHDAEEATSLIRTWAAEHPAVTLLEGKEVLELTVATQTKGDAIVALADAGEGILYIGDDATDETVFSVLGPDDVGVKVGPGPTAARFRVKNVAEVVELLEALALASG